MLEEEIKNQIKEAVQEVLSELFSDPIWIAELENNIVTGVSTKILTDVNASSIKNLIAAQVDNFIPEIIEKVKSPGVSATDNSFIVENSFVGTDAEFVGTVVVNDLILKGSVNVDNRSWNDLVATIANQTFEKLDVEWRDIVATDVSKRIQDNGIDFSEIRVAGEPLINDNILNKSIKKSSLDEVGVLKHLQIKGGIRITSDECILPKTVSINTLDLTLPLNIGCQNVVVGIGSFKLDQAFIGTTTDSELALGVNKQSMLVIDKDGTVTVSKLKIGNQKISFSNKVPGYAGLPGDIVFSTNPEQGTLGWVCLGLYKWKNIKIA